MKVILCICLFFALTQARSYRGDKVFRVTINSEKQLETLQNLAEDYELDFWKEPRTLGQTADIRVPLVHLSQFLVHLTTSRMNYEVFIEDVQELIDQQTTPHPSPKDLASFNYEVYHNFEEIQTWIDDMDAASHLATKSVVGTTYEGRTFSALTISTGTGRPQFVINCGIHAREWVTPATCMFSAKYLVDGYNNDDDEITTLLDNVDFVFIPSSNPDGYAYTWSNDRMWRKTRSINGVACVGVDPNRNWDSNHCGSGASSSPCSETYCGPSPFSEACTLAQKNFVEGLPNPKMYVDVHSYSQMWMFPYGYTTANCADHSTLNTIAADSVEAIRNTHGKIYESGSIADVIYVASGSTADYYYDVSGIKCSFATELRDTGRYGFLLPASQIAPTAEESFAAFKVMAQAIIDGDCN